MDGYSKRPVRNLGASTGDSSLAEDAAPEYVLALHLFFTLVTRVDHSFFVRNVETNQRHPKKVIKEI